MNKRQKEIYGLSLEDEKALLKQFEQNYINALADIKVKIKKLQEMPDTQSRAYQIDFQKHLEAEINGYLDVLESNNVQSIEDYYQLCYENGFIGNAYTLQSYNVGVIAPINQDDVINATKMTVDGVKLSTKISGNTALLKKQVVQEIQRGFSVAMPFADIARNISARGQADMNRAMRIARTEGNRIYNTSAVDYAKVAKDAGCDIVKQWVAVLDARTRDSHQAVDGEWVEMDAKFSNGLRYPCDPNGSAAEVVNCRCKVAHLPRWYVEKDYPRLRRDNETGEIIECRNYAEYKEKYLNISTNNGNIISGGISGALNPNSKRAEEHAAKYYEEIRKRTSDIDAIVKHTEFTKEQITEVKQFLFIDEQQLDDGKRRFDPSFDIAQSWQRLTEGKHEPHDILLIKHELCEKQLMLDGMSQAEAHIKATRKYNYKRGVVEYNAKIKKYKK